MADILGTQLLDDTETGELTANMVDVLLPLQVEDSQSLEELSTILFKMQDAMLEHDCFAAIYVYDKKWWVRASAQIWLELSDFEYVANVLLKLCTVYQQK